MIADFIINIAAGIFLSIVVWFLFSFLQPRYLAWRYKAPPLRGPWSLHDSEAEDAPAVGTAEIKQAGELIDAVVTRTRSRKGKPISRTFNYKGTIRDGQVLLSFEEPVSGGFIRGNLTLKLSSNLKFLSGITVYLDRELGNVVSHPIFFRRL